MRFAFLLLILLAGCAGAPVTMQRGAQIDTAFSFNGRVAIKHGEQRDSAGMRWTHRAPEDEISLLAPLGQTVARIHSDAQGVTLDASGKHYAAQDTERLMQQVLGWSLPVSGLRHWIIAMPAPASEYNIELNPNGQTSLLRQQGWDIRYSRYASTAKDALPLRVSLRHDDIEVLLLIDEWEAR
jgi:outer membrane lipoprotein LolB